VYYNLGRAMHQLNILPAALFYYKRALELGPSVRPDEQGKKTEEEEEEKEDKEDIFDLKREIAFNVSLIYQNSGNIQLARYYIEKYIVL
jgi:general transcription factor 3C polypeptide 3 (transcription factor C subunit 4)